MCVVQRRKSDASLFVFMLSALIVVGSSYRSFWSTFFFLLTPLPHPCYYHTACGREDFLDCFLTERGGEKVGVVVVVVFLFWFHMSLCA